MRPTSEALAEKYAAKSNEELLSLHVSGTLTDLAYEVLEQELGRRGMSVPNRPDVSRVEEQVRQQQGRATLAAHWKGQAPLSSAYWLIGTIGLWLVYGAVVLTKMFLPVLMPVAWTAFVAYLVFAWVSIWRCWQNTDWPVWGYVARTLVILNAIVVFLVALVLIKAALQPQSVIQG